MEVIENGYADIPSGAGIQVTMKSWPELGFQKTIPAIKAVIDTGTSRTVIDQTLINRLGIKAKLTTKFVGPSPKEELGYLYPIILVFQNKLPLRITAAGRKIHSQFEYQCIIGRDVLKYGMFIYNGENNSFTLTLSN